MSRMIVRRLPLVAASFLLVLFVAERDRRKDDPITYRHAEADMQVLILVFTVVLTMAAALATAAGVLNLFFRVISRRR
ncbi:MAG TPA: hypothetical protein VD788_12590 [Candidatus Polarisedimenticolaceae bacterium]|nr:hypothetical protein [Candidatus Polarisedimenticolaceae bacterium]